MSDVFIQGLVDLFGDPVPASRGRKGRPPHVPTVENRRFVQIALACNRTEAEIAAALRITERTLNRHYFHELRGKASARLRLEMKNMAAIIEQVEAGKPSAMSLLAKIIERQRQAELPERMKPTKDKAPASLGKKAERKIRAAEGHKDSPWGGLLRH